MCFARANSSNVFCVDFALGSKNAFFSLLLVAKNANTDLPPLSFSAMNHY
jgi:hypothetical protein